MRQRAEVAPEHRPWMDAYLERKGWTGADDLTPKQWKQLRAAYRQMKVKIKILARLDGLDSVSHTHREGDSATTASLNALLAEQMAKLPKSASRALLAAAKRMDKASVAVMQDCLDRKSAELEREMNIKLQEQRDTLIKLQKEAEAEEKQWANLITPLHGLMTRDEFLLVRGCLHPDKHDNDPKYNKAYDIFSRCEKTVPKKMLKASSEACGWPRKRR